MYSSLIAQERIVSRDVTEYDLGNGRKQTVIQPGRNYFLDGSWRRYDFSIRSEASGVYNRKVENDYTLRFSASSAQSYRVEKGDKYVEWELQNAANTSTVTGNNTIMFPDPWNSADVRLQPVPGGVKEQIILKEHGAPLSYLFKINTNLAISSDSARIFFSDNDGLVFHVPPLFAVDGGNRFVDVDYSLYRQQSEHYLSVRIDTAGTIFPITIDPSTITKDTLATAVDNCMYGASGYEDKNWGGWSSFRAGGDYTGSTWVGLLKFNLDSIPSDAIIDNASLKLYINDIGGSPGPRVMRILKKDWGEGNGSNSAAQSGESSWNSAQRYTADWDSGGASGAGDAGDSYGSFTSTSAGWETVNVKTLVQEWKSGNNYGVRLAIEPPPSNSDYVYYTSSESDSVPTLIVDWFEIVTPLAPSLALPDSADACSTLTLSCADTLNDSNYIYYAHKYMGGTFSGQHVNTGGYALSEGDTAIAHKTYWQNITLRNLTPNTNISILTEAYHYTDHRIHRSSSSNSLVTRARRPDTLIIDYDTDSTLAIDAFGEDDNPGGTWYCIYDTTQGEYIDLDGTHKVYVKWYTKSTWESAFPLSVQELTLGQSYTFKTRAMNADSIETSWGLPVTRLVANRPDPPENLILFPSNKMTLMWSPNTEFQLKGYNVYRDTTYPPTDYDSLAFVPKPDSMFVDSTVALGVTYYYWITAIDSQGVESGASDYVTGYPGYVLSIPDVYGYEHDTLKIPIVTSDSMTLDEIYSFQFHIGYDETVVQFSGFDTAGTLSSNFYTVQVHDTLGVVNIAAFDTVPIQGGNDTIIFLNYVIDIDTGSNAGHSDLIFVSALVDDDNNYIYVSDGRISVKGLLYGDPSLNDSITIYDCSLVLQHNIGKKYMNGLQELVSDVSGNGLVTVYDASLILKYTIGMIQDFPAGDTLLTKTANPPPQNAALNLAYAADEENQLVTVEVSVAGAGSDVSAIALDVGYSSEDLEFERYSLTPLTEEFMAGVDAKDGVVKIGLANGHSLTSDGTLIRLYFRMKETAQAPPHFRLLAAMLNETMLDVITGLAHEVELPKTYELSQNYPNPFNPETEIAFYLPGARFVKLVIYNILGQEVKTLVNDYREAGSYKIKWDGTNKAGAKVASGVYIYRFRAEDNGRNVNFEKVKKMVLLK